MNGRLSVMVAKCHGDGGCMPLPVLDHKGCAVRICEVIIPRGDRIASDCIDPYIRSDQALRPSPRYNLVMP